MAHPHSPLTAKPSRFWPELLALVAFMLVAAAVFGVFVWQRIYEEETERLSHLTRLAARSTQLFYAQFESALSDLATELTDEGLAESHVRRVLERLEQSTPGIKNVALFDSDSKLIAATQSAEHTALYAPQQAGFLAFNTRDPLTALEFSRPVRMQGRDEWWVPLRFRTLDGEGKSNLVITALVSLEEQWRGLSELAFPQHFVIGIMRDDDYLQGRWPLAKDHAALFEQALAGPIMQRPHASSKPNAGSTVGVSPVTAEKRLYTYQAVPSSPLTLYVSIPYETLWAHWLERVQAPYVLLLSLAFAAFWAHRRTVVQHHAWSYEVQMRQTRLELLHSLRSGVPKNAAIEEIIARSLDKLANRYPDLKVSYGILAQTGRVTLLGSRCAHGSNESIVSSVDYSVMPEYLEQLLSGIVGVIEDCVTDPRVRAVPLQNAAARALLDAPLAHGHNQVGLISLHAPLPRAWTEDQIATASEVAAQLTLILREVQAERARLAALTQLRERERAFRSIAELSSDWFWEQDEELRFKPHPVYEIQKNYPHPAASDYVGKRRWEVERNRFDPSVLEHHMQVVARREPFRDLEYERVFTDGSIRHIRVSGVPLFDSAGRFTGYHGIGKDITDQKNSELALRESEATLSAIFHATHDAMFIVDLDAASIVDCNRRALETFDAPDKNAIRDTEGPWWQRLPLTLAASAIKAHLENAEYWHQELELVTQKGRYFWGDVTVAKLYLPGRSLHLMRVADITERRRAEEALRSSESIFSAVFNSSRDALFLGNIANGTVMECNPRAVELFDAPSKNAILSRPGHVLLRHPLSRTRLGEILGKLEFGEILKEDMLFRNHKGRSFWGEMVAVKLDSPLNHVYLVRVADISERKESEQRLRASEQRFRDLTELSSDWFWEQDAEFRFTLLSNSALRTAPRIIQNLLGKRRWEVSEIEDLDDPKWVQHRKTLEAHEPFHDFVYRHKSDNGTRWISVSGVPLHDEHGRFVGYRGVGADITDRKQSEDRIRYLAQHDDLTGLYNRASFHNTLGRAVDHARRHNRRLAVLFIDLDRFKNINDTLGHDAGDAVLREIAARLRGCLRESDIVARQGGDEFVVLLEDFGTDNDLSGVARKVLYAFSQPFSLSGKEFMLTASVGIGTFPDDGQDMSSLLKAADIAMYRAKESGRNNFQFYSPQMNVHSLERLALEAALKRALERGELRLHYQPKLDLSTGCIAGTEALLRWEHPDNGMIPPLQFIPIAEETGLIAPIGAWVLLEACRQLHAWHSAGWNQLTLAVNLSARQFMQDSLVEEIMAALRYSNMPPQFLELEITESAVMQKPDRAAKVLEELHRIGLSIAIDDFGTGHSSLAYLRRFPVNTLKIDRSFIRDVPFDAEDVEITRAIIALGRSLHLRVVGEGVETAAQRDFLATAGCDEAQGFLIGKPMAPADFERFLQQYQPHAAPSMVN